MSEREKVKARFTFERRERIEMLFTHKESLGLRGIYIYILI